MLEENTDKENNACKGMRGGGVKYHGLLRNCCNYGGGVKSLEVGQRKICGALYTMLRSLDRRRFNMMLK